MTQRLIFLRIILIDPQQHLKLRDALFVELDVVTHVAYPHRNIWQQDELPLYPLSIGSPPLMPRSDMTDCTLHFQIHRCSLRARQ